jgi:hypothetical protein
MDKRWYPPRLVHTFEPSRRNDQRNQVTESASDLKKLLNDIFDDEIVEPNERQHLAKFTKHMKRDETLAVFQEFLHEKWGEVIADDVITGSERRLLGHIMAELDLDIEHLPVQARMALKDL